MRHTSIVKGVNALVEANTKTFTSGIKIVNLPAAGVSSHVSFYLSIFFLKVFQIFLETIYWTYFVDCVQLIRRIFD